MTFTAQQIAAIKAELTGDPYALGYAPFVATRDLGSLITLLTFVRDGVTPCPANGVVGRAGAVTGATNATPVVITSAAHGLATGDYAAVSGVLGNAAANGTFQVTKVNANSFSLNGAAGSGAYVSGGAWAWLVSGVRNGDVSTQSLLGAIDNRDLITQGGASAVTADQYGKLMMLALIAGDGTVDLVNDDGSDNQNLHSLKQALNNTNGSQTRLAALSKRTGSRVEQLLVLSGVALTEANVVAALA